MKLVDENGKVLRCVCDDLWCPDCEWKYATMHVLRALASLGRGR